MLRKSDTTIKSSIAGAAVTAFIFASAQAAVIAFLPPSLTADGPGDCPKVGDRCDDGTVYVGARRLRDWEGTALGDFNLFTAPEDLKDDQGNRLIAFNDAVAHVAGLRNWHGHDGGRFERDDALYAAIGKGRYSGEWFIPPRGVLVEHLFQNRDEGALKGTFITTLTPEDGYFLTNFYWSSTELRSYYAFGRHGPPAKDILYGIDFVDGGFEIVSPNSHPVDKDLYWLMSARPVRAEPRP